MTGSGKTTLAARLSEATGVPWHSVDDLTGRNSQLRLGAQGLIAELTVTARSFRGLADELERHPESLLRGKRGGP